jgi:hypothetical protein
MLVVKDTSTFLALVYQSIDKLCTPHAPSGLAVCDYMKVMLFHHMVNLLRELFLAKTPLLLGHGDQPV